MSFQSKYISEHLKKFAPIPLTRETPVSPVDYNLRREIPDIEPHIHDCLEIGYCHAGDGIFLVEDKILPFKEGDALFINNCEVHIMMGSPGGETTWSFVNFDPHLLLDEQLKNNPEILETAGFCGRYFNNIIEGGRHVRLANVIRDFIDVRSRNRPEDKNELRALCWLFLLRLNEYYHPDPVGNKLEIKDTSRLAPALHYITQNLDKPLRIPHLAALCNNSESNFRKLFHKTLGCSPKQYLKRMRLKTAAVMLENSDTQILEIAYKCGFETLSNFNRQFGDFYQMPPSKLRKS